MSGKGTSLRGPARSARVVAVLLLLGLFPPCCVLSAAAGPSAAPAYRPSIILLMADDFGYECVACNGGESYRTSRLDAMAAGGLRFSNAHSQPVCTPTRVQLMTGRWNARNYWAFGSLHPDEVTFGHVLSAAGYATCVVGKWQLSGRGAAYPGTHPDEAGFDEWCLFDTDEESKGSRYWNPTIKANRELLPGTEGRYGPDIFSAYAMDFVSRNRDRPFFLYYPMVLPHGPHHPTPDTPGYDPDAKPRRDLANFADMVNYVDKIVGRILDHVDREGIAGNTLVLFTGDNGTDKKLTSRFRGRTVRGGKGRTLDVSTHVPLIAQWKGVLPEGSTCPDLVDFSDMLPTFVDMSGASVPEGLSFDGVSFLPQLRGLRGEPKDFIYCYYEKGKYSDNSASDEGGPTPEPALSTDKAKKKVRPFVHWVHDGRWKLMDSGAFYDLFADPDEQRPIAPGEAGPEGETRRAAFDGVLARHNAIKKQYGPAARPAPPTGDDL